MRVKQIHIQTMDVNDSIPISFDKVIAVLTDTLRKAIQQNIRGQSF